MRTITETTRRYINAVEAELSDLDADDRAELLSDVEEHLTEVAGEHEGALEERLGDPVAYASELRSSAGLPARSVAKGERAAAWRSVLDRIISPQRIRDARVVYAEVEPGWWVLRGYLFALAIARIGFHAGLSDIPVPRVYGSLLIGFLVVAICVFASFALGRFGRRARSATAASALASLLVVVMTLAVLSDAKVGIGMRAAATPIALPSGGVRHADGTDVLNVCPYGAEGKPLSRVLLFDQAGRAITEVSGVPASSADALNAYPRAVRATSGDGSPVVTTCPKLAAVTITTDSQPSWIEAMVGDVPVYQALVGAGETRTFYGSRVSLVVGNSGAVTIRANGKTLGKPGALGVVYRAIFDRTTQVLPPSQVVAP